MDAYRKNLLYHPIIMLRLRTVHIPTGPLVLVNPLRAKNQISSAETCIHNNPPYVHIQLVLGSTLCICSGADLCIRTGDLSGTVWRFRPPDDYRNCKPIFRSVDLNEDHVNHYLQHPLALRWNFKSRGNKVNIFQTSYVVLCVRSVICADGQSCANHTRRMQRKDILFRHYILGD